MNCEACGHMEFVHALSDGMCISCRNQGGPCFPWGFR